MCSGCVVFQTVRVALYRGKFLCSLLQEVMVRTHPAYSLADLIRDPEQLPRCDAKSYAVMSYRSQAHRRDTTTLRAIRITTQLTGNNLRFQVCRDDRRGLCKYALSG